MIGSSGVVPQGLSFRIPAQVTGNVGVLEGIPVQVLFEVDGLDGIDAVYVFIQLVVDDLPELFPLLVKALDFFRRLLAPRPCLERANGEEHCAKNREKAKPERFLHFESDRSRRPLFRCSL